MKPKPKRSTRPPRGLESGTLSFGYVVRSFIGYLEGTEKAAHTIKSYRSDLRTFLHFLEKSGCGKAVGISSLGRRDLERFQEYLKAQGLKTNSRRRKILTVRKLLDYLSKRKKITTNPAHRLPAPEKVERIPFTAPVNGLLAIIRSLPANTELATRNRVMLWTLTETGARVSEVARLRFSDWSAATNSASLSIPGKFARSIPISPALFEAVQDLRALVHKKGAEKPEAAFLFVGFNKFGPLGSAITPRGVELLVRSYAARLGFREITPRTFRHSIVLHWAVEGVTRRDILARLGLRTPYAFRIYEPLLANLKSTP